MLDIKTIRERTEDVKRACETKGYPVDVDRILVLDTQRRDLLQSSESRRARRNTLSSQIPGLPGDEKKAAIMEVRTIKAELSQIEVDLEAVQKEYKDLMLGLPQLPADDVPVGKSEHDNVVLRHEGEPRKFDFENPAPVDPEASLCAYDPSAAAKIAAAEKPSEARCEQSYPACLRGEA